MCLHSQSWMVRFCSLERSRPPYCLPEGRALAPWSLWPLECWAIAGGEGDTGSALSCLIQMCHCVEPAW